MMKYHTVQLPDGRWGIFEDDRLLATIGSYAECLDVLKVLRSRKSITEGKSDFPTTVILPSQLKRNFVR
jgi:hypothetical protein